jgi:predicted dehydrogenase
VIDDLREAEFGIAIVGYGLAGAYFHAPFIATTPGLRVAAVVTSDPNRQAHARASHPDARIETSVDRLWSAPDIDAIVIASPNRTHVPLARAAIDARKPMVVDKPLAATAGEARAVVDEARRAGVLLTVFQNRRWDGDFLTARRLIETGELGAVLRFESRFERWRPVPKGGWRERGDPEEAGGLLYDLGSHLIDQARLLFGPPTNVYAEIDRRRAGVEVDDDVFVALTHASGVRSHLWMSAVAAQPGPRLRVIFERGTYTKFGLDIQEDALRSGARPDADAWGEEPEEQWGMLTTADGVRALETERGAYQQFYFRLVNALRGEVPPPVDPMDAVATLEIIERARRT